MSNNQPKKRRHNIHTLTAKKRKDKNTPNTQSMKDRFLQAVANGELGVVEDRGVVVTLKEFKVYFSDIKTQYVSSFLPAATFEPGQSTLSHTKYVFRLRKGVYLVHPDALK